MKDKGVKEVKILDHLALLLVIIGGIHLLLIGLLDFNIVQIIFGPAGGTLADEVIYTIIGASSLWATKYFGYTPKGGSRLKGR